jgi:ribosomal protein S27AE
MKSREIVIAILVAIGVVLVGMILLGILWGYSGMWGTGGMWGFPTHMRTPGMMGGLPVFGWLGFCLVPLLLGGLLIGGIVWMLSNRDGAKDVKAAQESCPNCGEAVIKNWNNCPNCGQSLRNG